MNNAYIRAQQLKVKEAKFPFVKIGTQYWTNKNLSLSVTPQGNTIKEMQANGNVEKIVNAADREFSSDTGFWGKDNPVSITGGVMRFANTTVTYNGFYKNLGLANKWIKVTYTILNYVSGAPFFKAGLQTPSKNANGTYTDYLYATSSDAAFMCGTIGASFDVDNISIQEIGWSGSQELYDGIYAQTSGTVEQKTYAAVKAAAMLCHYNNDVSLGAVYGKLYNWFAVKLFQMDIDYYNAANPTKKWANGFRMPTQAEFQTLSTYLGGDAVSGGKLKEAGLEHWNNPNTGADNSSGFSAIGSGYIDGVGAFLNINVFTRFWSISENGIYGGRMLLYNTTANSGTDNNAATKPYGYHIRLIKA